MEAVHKIGVTYFLVMFLVSFWMSKRLARTTHNPPRYGRMNHLFAAQRRNF